MRVFICLISLLITGGVLTAGCIQQHQESPVQKVQPAQTGVSAPVSGPVSAPDSPLSGEYPAPPEEISVTAQINDKDITDRSITVIFPEGKGRRW